MRGRHRLLGGVVVLAALAGCAGTPPQASRTPAPTPAASGSTAGSDRADDPQPDDARADVPQAADRESAEVTWTVPDLEGYAPTDAAPHVRQLSSVADSCLYQLAQDTAPPDVTDVTELIDPVLQDLGAERTGSSPATLASADGPLPATEVTFTAELDGLPAQGVLLLAAPPGHGLLLSVTYVCTGGPVPTDTWEELQDGTEVRLDAVTGAP